jgi:hypothetical protein
MGRETGDEMAKVTLPYVEFKRDRHGEPKYWYFRHNERRWRMRPPSSWLNITG